MAKNPAQEESPNTDAELLRTQRPERPSSDFIWEQDTFRRIGYGGVNMTKALSKFDLAQKESFKQAALDFSAKGDYAQTGFVSLMCAISKSLKHFPVSAFDTSWVAQTLKVPLFVLNIGTIKRFFVFWKARNPQAISDEALQLLIKIKSRAVYSNNVLSDDPEKSWLSDEEYEALLASVWRNYEDGLFSTSRTLITLLSMQYARRPIQIAHLKFQDVRNAASDDSSGLSGPVVSFPGGKDMGAETGFRDSKFEHHPLPGHLWNLFEIQRNEIQAMVEFQLDIHLSDSELQKLPVFASAGRIERAKYELTSQYRVDWRSNLDHHLFHMRPLRISQILAWTPNSHRDIEPPLSHRTGRPLVVSATRLRHTRARQLARKGVLLHVLSHWLGHTNEKSLRAYYNDPAEDARKLDEAMAPTLMPLAMAFAGKLIDSEEQASRSNDPISRLEFAKNGELKNVGNCGKHSFCATTSVPIPCYRCRHFEPLVSAPHKEVLEALKIRQEEENQALRIGGARDLLVPIDLSADILAVKNCIDRCNARKRELGIV
ncbi:site-specific integrase [Halomonas sp. ZH2S]|uniref:Site-specific integrase n=1 Tax=Vreelandella zhuhanensis TaxID=2684210 RepID=A0A7X3H125_9GAMM|nr:site-specific integrase [Halomonas zhuhanensis]MWJ28582.1 site-specific integrase [Halomonas zhuhanensis]